MLPSFSCCGFPKIRLWFLFDRHVLVIILSMHFHTTSKPLLNNIQLPSPHPHPVWYVLPGWKLLIQSVTLKSQDSNPCDQYIREPTGIPFIEINLCIILKEKPVLFFNWWSKHNLEKTVVDNCSHWDVQASFSLILVTICWFSTGAPPPPHSPSTCDSGLDH